VVPIAASLIANTNVNYLLDLHVEGQSTRAKSASLKVEEIWIH
jgi:hypothetical protein